MQTFVFADLAGFTALTEAHGDEHAADLAAEFRDTVRLLLPAGGELVKMIGDAAMVRCDDAGQAIELGLRVVRKVGSQPGFPIARVGLHTGPAVQRDGDWFGSVVNLAARISGRASGGEVLLSDSTRRAAGAADGIELVDRGRVELRNVRDPVHVFAARIAGPRDERGLAVDPVCRMVVDPSRSAGRLVHDQVAYEFCSLRCAGEFARAPDRDAGRADAR